MNTKRYKAGTRVRITGVAPLSPMPPEDRAKWTGMTGTVVALDVAADPFIQPDSERPDGFGLATFIWPSEHVEAIDPEETDR